MDQNIPAGPKVVLRAEKKLTSRSRSIGPRQ